MSEDENDFVLDDVPPKGLRKKLAWMGWRFYYWILRGGIHNRGSNFNEDPQNNIDHTQDGQG